MTKTVGIIGGMGPLATADLFRKIILHTRAANDREHLHIVIDNNTSIPDRTAAILQGGDSPLPELVKSVRLLERAGADFLIMPCNTAHYFYDAICKSINLPLLHMIRLTAEEAKALGVRRAGLLATDGTIATGIYDAAFAAVGIELMKPQDSAQRAIMSLIYDDIKGGKPLADRSVITDALAKMQQDGAETFILGCTEMPIAFSKYAFPFPYMDATDVLAKQTVLFAGGALA